MRLIQGLPAAQGVAGQNRRSVQLAGFDATLIIDDDVITSYENESPLSRTVPLATTTMGPSILSVLATIRSAQETEDGGNDGERLDHLVARQRSMNINESADGVSIELGPSWDSEYMQRPPEERDR